MACTNAHKICESCYAKILSDSRLCPQGSCPYDEPPRRCRELEAIVDNADIELMCRNADGGCNVELKNEELEKHEGICNFRKVPCPDTTCEEMIVVSKVDKHINEEHQNSFKMNNTHFELFFEKKVLEDEYLDHALMEWTNEQGRTFYPQIYKKNDLWYFWIKAQMNPKAACSFEITAEVKNKSTGFK